MRVLANIPHPNYNITIHYYNEKFILRFEAGPYEQAYKFTKEMADTEDKVKAIVTAEFLQTVQENFDRMHQQFLKSLHLANG